MARSSDNLARKLLLTRLDVADPFIGQNVIEGGPLFDTDLEHASNDIPALTWQQSQKPPGTLDDFLALARRLGRSRKGRGFFACGAAGLVRRSISVVHVGLVGGRSFLGTLWGTVFLPTSGACLGSIGLHGLVGRPLFAIDRLRSLFLVSSRREVGR